MFDQLQASRAEVAAAFGAPLVWERRPESDVSFVRCRLPGGGLADEERWTEIQRTMLVTMARLMAAFGPAVDRVSAASE